MTYKTRHMPLEPARRKLKPKNQARAANKRHQRDFMESVRRIAMAKAKMI